MSNLMLVNRLLFNLIRNLNTLQHKSIPGRVKAFLLVLVLGLSNSVVAEVSLPRVLSEGLVLQMNKPMVIWGWASSEKSVQVKLGDQKPVTAFVVDGQWRAELPPMSAGGPYTLQVQGENTVTVSDVLIGLLWVASGQSNMQTPMYRLQERFPEEFSAKNYPQVRQFTVPQIYDYKQPQNDLPSGEWKSASSDTLGSFSGVAYYFAKALNSKLDIPVGIVLSAHGGAPAEGWMSREALQRYPHYLKKIQPFTDDENLRKVIARDQGAHGVWSKNLTDTDLGLQQQWEKPDTDTRDWNKMAIPSFWDKSKLNDMIGSVWFKQTISVPPSHAGKSATLKLGRIVDSDTAYVNGTKVGGTSYQYPPRRYAIPEGVLRAGDNDITVRVVKVASEAGFVPDNPYSVAFDDLEIDLKGEWRYKVGAIVGAPPKSQFSKYTNPLGFANAMLAPLLNLQIEGVIWYQGESNVGKSQEYKTLFPDMIYDWRTQWRQGYLPFLYVQLANYLPAQAEPSESGWAELREAQRLTATVANTAMVTAVDVGQWNDLHPTDKKSVGERLALAARNKVYGETNLLYTGPAPQNVSREDSSIVIEYQNVGERLTVKGKKLNGFAIAGEDKKYYWADAIIKNNRVVLSSRKVKKPRFVRYAWADNPASANLYNSADLPAIPFQADVE